MCIRDSVKDLYADIFDNWSARYAEEAKTNPHAAADAYLMHARGFDISKLRGSYTQETYHDREKGITSATVRFPVARTYWERLIDQPSRFGKKKARFQYGGSYLGEWWKMCIRDRHWGAGHAACKEPRSAAAPGALHV